MNFEFKTATNDGTPITLVLKPAGDAPGAISRHNIGNIEAQFWANYEWGLVEPKHWPEGSDKKGTNVLDVIPQRELTECYNKWQSADPQDSAPIAKKPEE
jgi:hypothetical protein